MPVGIRQVLVHQLMKRLGLGGTVDMDCMQAGHGSMLETWVEADSVATVFGTCHQVPGDLLPPAQAGSSNPGGTTFKMDRDPYSPGAYHHDQQYKKGHPELSCE